MRTITYTIAAAITLAAAVTVFASSPGLAASKSNREIYNELQQQHPQLFRQCQRLATKRGFNNSSDEIPADRRRFVRECMQGKIPR
jgi:hypothetical protein